MPEANPFHELLAKELQAARKLLEALQEEVAAGEALLAHKGVPPMAQLDRWMSAFNDRAVQWAELIEHSVDVATFLDLVRWVTRTEPGGAEGVEEPGPETAGPAFDEQEGGND